MAGLLWTIIVVLFVLWLIGFSVHIGGGLIHLLLVIAADLDRREPADGTRRAPVRAATDIGRRGTYIAPRRFVYEPFFFGTFAPSRRASLKPIAMACLRLVTFLPDRPDAASRASSRPSRARPSAGSRRILPRRFLTGRFLASGLLLGGAFLAVVFSFRVVLLATPLLAVVFLRVVVFRVAGFLSRGLFRVVVVRGIVPPCG